MADDFDDSDGGDDFDPNDQNKFFKMVREGLRWSEKLHRYIEDTPNAYPEIQAFVLKPSKETFEGLHNSKFPEELNVIFGGLLQNSCCELHAFSFFVSYLLNERQRRLLKIG